MMPLTDQELTNRITNFRTFYRDTISPKTMEFFENSFSTPEAKQTTLVSGAALVVCTSALYFYAHIRNKPVVLVSQSSTPQDSLAEIKADSNLFQSISESKIVAIFGKSDDRHNLYGFPQKLSDPCTWKPIAMVYRGTVQPVHPLVLQGLNSGLLTIDNDTHHIYIQEYLHDLFTPVDSITVPTPLYNQSPPCSDSDSESELLVSQSSHSFCTVKTDDEKSAMPTEKPPGNLVTMAGAHHQHRQRIMKGVAPSLNSFDFSSTFNDTNTRDADVKSLVQKFQDSTRSHFASHSGVLISQFDGIKDTLKEIKVLVPGPGGSLQEELRSIPEESMDSVEEDSMGV